MRFLQIGFTACNFGMLIALLIYQKRRVKELKTFMTEQETRLNEQLDRQNTALTAVAGGVGELNDTVSELKTEIQTLKENNPDLEDEIARATELADKAQSIASGMASNLPDVPDNPTNPEFPTNPDTPASATDGSPVVTGESPVDDATNGDATEADTEEFPNIPDTPASGI